jgi:hypothetical protein
MYYTHINRGVIDSNRKHGRNDPPVRFQKGRYGKPTYAHAVQFPAGGVVRYDPTGTILPCGARLVIESKECPVVVPNADG